MRKLILRLNIIIKSGDKQIEYISFGELGTLRCGVEDEDSWYSHDPVCTRMEVNNFDNYKTLNSLSMIIMIYHFHNMSANDFMIRRRSRKIF